MSRKHDKRARRPPLVPEENGSDLDIRAGKQWQELGRNPRGKTAPVNEKSARYKKAQARKFAEHGSDKSQDAHRTDADMGDSAMPKKIPDDNPVIEQSSDIRAVSQNEGQPVSSSDVQETPKTSGTKTIPAETAKGSVIPNDSSSANSTLSHERTPRSKQKRQEQLQHNRNRAADSRNDVKRKKNKQRNAAKFLPPDGIKPDKTEASVINTAPLVVADTEKSGAEPYIIRHERQDEVSIDLVKKQPENSPQSEVQPSTEETLPEAQSPASDKIISHERNSQVTHERPSRLRHSRTPIIPADPTRRKQKYKGDVSSKQDSDKQIIDDSAADSSEERENYDADWRRADYTLWILFASVLRAVRTP